MKTAALLLSLILCSTLTSSRISLRNNKVSLRLKPSEFIESIQYLYGAKSWNNREAIRNADEKLINDIERKVSNLRNLEDDVLTDLKNNLDEPLPHNTRYDDVDDEDFEFGSGHRRIIYM